MWGTLKSTNPAVNAIIQNSGQSDQAPTVGAPLQQLSWYNTISAASIPATITAGDEGLSR
jgi:hypothetical protein